MKIHKLAGIDIGSNSVRLLVANVMRQGENVNFKKSSLTRLPIRLGIDAFEKGKIIKENQKRLLWGMQAYQKIMAVHGVERYRACATSALREADNGWQVAENIYRETGINIELISGKEEARMIFSPDFVDTLSGRAEHFFYIDVGGGSTELTLFSSGEIAASHSFKIGTIRLMTDKVKEKHWEAMRQWIKEVTGNLPRRPLMVGSGGNINRAFKLAEKKKGETMSYKLLAEMRAELKQFDYEERIVRFDLNPDRSDVILPALKIYLSAMKWARAEEMMVPKKGLADGIVRNLYREHFYAL